MDRRSDAPNDLQVATEAALEHLARTWVSAAQAERVGRIVRGFARYCARGHGLAHLDEVTPEVASAFVDAPGQPGEPPSLPARHLRRSALRLLYRAGRAAGLCQGDPTLDVILPPRDQLHTRPLADGEVVLCRAAASWSLSDRRRAAAWALAEATCRSREVGHITRGDVDLAGGRVWIHGGRVTSDRWGDLDDWGCDQLARRLEQLSDDPSTPVVYEGGLAEEVGQISSCLAVRDVLVRAGLGREPGARPASVAAWKGNAWLRAGLPIDEVTRRLGLRSLDRAAAFVGWDWLAGQP